MTGTPVARAWPAAIGALLVISAVITIGYDPVVDVHPALRHLGPSADAWLGTDSLGRPIAKRLAAGTHAVLVPGVLAALFSTTLGTAAGATAGWFGGLAAQALGVLRDTLSAIPDIVLALLMVLAVGDGQGALVVGIGIAAAPRLAASVEDRIAGLRQRDFVLASRVHGVSTGRVLAEHLVWGACRGLLARHALYCFGAYVVLETTLAYLGGVGTQEPLPSWGNILASVGPDPRAPRVGRLAPVLVVGVVLQATSSAARHTPDPGAGQ